MTVITARTFAKRVLRALKEGPSDIKACAMGEYLEEEDIRRAFNQYLGSRELGQGSLRVELDRGWGCNPKLEISLELGVPPRNTPYYTVEEDLDGAKVFLPHFYPSFKVNHSTTDRDLTQTRAFLKALTQLVEVGEMLAGLTQTEAVVSDDEADRVSDLESGVYTQYTGPALGCLQAGTMLITSEGQRFFKYSAGDGKFLWRTVEYLEGYKDGEVTDAQLAEFEFLMRHVDTPKVNQRN